MRIVYLPYPKEKSDEIINYFINLINIKNEERGRSWSEWLDLMEYELHVNKKTLIVLIHL